MASKNSLVLLLFFVLICNSRCEARGLRRSKKYSLISALYMLKFVTTVEPTHPPPPPGGPSSNGDAMSLADADDTTPTTTNSPVCINSPLTPETTPLTAPPGPFNPDQPPPLPPFITPTPLLGPNPPIATPAAPGVGPGPPTVVPSPISIVPSPPELVPTSPGVFMPPIVYPPPLAPPLPPGAGQPLWCVAKPTVPDPIIQDAMDYACGSGAECKSIDPSGACYQPDTVLAHASYAFNSYWQRTKADGGTCDFGGTAMLVTRDPSYDECQFNLL